MKKIVFHKDGSIEWTHRYNNHYFTMINGIVDSKPRIFEIFSEDKLPIMGNLSSEHKTTFYDYLPTKYTTIENVIKRFENPIKYKKPNIILYYNDGTKQEYPDATEMTWDLISGKTSNSTLNTTLVKAELNNGVTSIGSYGLYKCKSLTSVNIPDSVTSIGKHAFHYCSNLTSVTIGNGVTSIGEQAFRYCFNLTSVNIPDSVTNIGYNAFVYCPNLTSITVDSNNTFYHSNGNCLMQDNVVLLGCSTSVIPTTATSIKSNAFYGCYGLTSITISDSITNIEFYAFYGCSSLASVTYKGVVYTSKSALETALTNNGVIVEEDAFSETGLSA